MGLPMAELLEKVRGGTPVHELDKYGKPGLTGEQALKATGCSSAISPFSAGASVRASAGSNAGAFLRMYLH